MSLPLIQTSLNAGEISPELYGHVDFQKYPSALTTARNVIINYKGGALSRGGLALVGVCKQAPPIPPRPITFQFNITQGYVLEFGNQYLRFVFQGGYVLEAGVAITGVTQGSPAVVSVTGQPFSNGDWVFISGVVGMTQLNGNTYIVALSASGHFALTDLSGNNVDSTGFTAYSSGGLASRLYTISTPYAVADLPYLKFAQSADVMSLTCSNPVTQTEYPPYDLTRYSGDYWTLTQTDFDPVIAAPTNVQAAAAALSPAGGTNATFAYVVTAVDAKGNESIASSPASCNGANLETQAGSNTVTWALVAGAQFYNVYRSPGIVDTGGAAQAAPIGAIMGFVGSAYGTQVVDSNPTADLTKTPPTHQNPFARGQIEAVEIISGGSAATSVTYAITTTAGVNFAGIPILVGGSLGGFLVQNVGSSFAPGDSIALNGVGFATGSIEFGTTNPSPGDTITLNSVTWTFVANGATGAQTNINGALSATVNQLVSDLSASVNALLTVASYAPDQNSSNLIITYKTAGTGGNAYTLAASRATPSGATLTGGIGTGTTGVAASGTLTFGGNPTNGQTIVLDGVTWTFVTSGATGNETNLSAVNLAGTLTQLQADLTASPNTDIALANYAASSTVLTITYKTQGVAGNAYTITGGTSGATPSAGTLTGGIDGSMAASLEIGPTSGTYPGVNAYFQQRHFFANSLNNPDTVWATQTGLYKNMDTSIPTEATDAITASPWTEQVNGIQWLIPMPGGLIAMTGSRAWQIIGEGSYQLNVQPITPATIQAQPQAFNGCSATIPPIVIDYDVLYVEALGNTTVRDLAWNFWVNIYTGNDLTVLSSHLFSVRSITQWAWARQPYKVVWATCNDGTFLSLTYLKEQEIYGWARHDTPGLAVGVTSVIEPPVNAVYMVVQRFPPYAAAGIYTMERMDDRVWQSIEDHFAVDSAVSNPMTLPTVPVTASAASGAGVAFTTPATGPFTAAMVNSIIRMGGGIATITAYVSATHVTGTWNLNGNPGPAGLPYSAAGAWSISTPVSALQAPHLAGMTLSGLADGVPIGNLTCGNVTGGITLPFAASNVKVGLPFTVQIQTPYLNGQEVLQGTRKVIPAVTVRLAGTANGFQVGRDQPDGGAQNPQQIGPAWSLLETANLTQPTGGQDPPTSYTSPGNETVTQVFTGDYYIIGGGASWESKGQVAIQQTLPVGIEITAIMPMFQPGDLPEGGRREQGPSPQRQPTQGPPQTPEGAYAMMRPRL